MTLKGIRNLQIVSVVLFGAACLMSLIILLFQRPFISLFSDDPDVLNQRVVPWPVCISLLVSLLAAVLFLVLCFSLKTAKGSRVSVISILIALYVVHYLVGPIVSRLYSIAINHHITNSQIAAYSIVSGAVSRFAYPLRLAGSLLMTLAMGGFYGYDPSEQESRGSMTLKGARILQTVAASLIVLALLLCLALTAAQDTVRRVFAADTDIRFRVVPWDTLISLALIAVPALVWLVSLFKRGGTARGIVVLAAVLLGVFLLAGLFIPSVIVSFYSMYGTDAVASYSLLSSAVTLLVNPLSGAAVTFMLFTLGGFFGKERKAVQVSA